MRSRDITVTDHTAEVNDPLYWKDRGGSYDINTDRWLPPQQSVDIDTGQVHDAPPTDPTPSLPLIQPTVGRVMWYQDQAKPHSLAAIIAFVHDSDTVNLTVFDEDGTATGIPFVRIWHGGDNPKPIGNYAEWMPYQIGQAKKHSEETK